MTMSKKDLQRWQESMHTLLSESQKAAILERFGTEPEPYEWSEPDIAEQIHKFLNHGYFQHPEPAFSADLPPSPPDEPF